VLTRVVHLEPVLAVDRCLEASCRDFDPMLDEVEACLTMRSPSCPLFDNAAQPYSQVNVTPRPMTSAVYGGEVLPLSGDFAPRRLG
jgi:hypothetical protein